MAQVRTDSLFVFGTMRDPDVLGIVLGRPITPDAYRPAWLPDHRIARVPDERYPVLVHAPGERARGDVIEGLGDEDFARIAFFEGDEYVFGGRTVHIEGEGPVRVFLCDEGDMDPGANEPWDLERWQREEKSSFLDVARKYMSYYDTGAAEEAEALWWAIETGRRGAAA